MDWLPAATGPDRTRRGRHADPPAVSERPHDPSGVLSVPQRLAPGARGYVPALTPYRRGISGVISSHSRRSLKNCWGAPVLVQDRRGGAAVDRPGDEPLDVLASDIGRVFRGVAVVIRGHVHLREELRQLPAAQEAGELVKFVGTGRASVKVSPSAALDRIDTHDHSKKRASAALSCGNPLSVGLTGFEPATP